MVVCAGWLLAALLLAVAAVLLIAVAAGLKLSWHARGLTLAAAVLLCEGRYGPSCATMSNA